jgi:zinc-ribbon domain
MAYAATLNENQQLMVIEQGRQTLITLTSSSPGQQQSQSSSISIGNWVQPPQLYKTQSGFILQLKSDRAEQFILIQAHSISTIPQPVLDHLIKIDLETIPDPTVSESNVKFEPMQPMRMGNMSMNMNPMSMQMGNMSMTMGQKINPPLTKRFCTQCGQEAQKSDRFCRSCGHQLHN